MSFDQTVELRVGEGVAIAMTVSFTERYAGPDEYRVALRRAPWAEVEAEYVWHLDQKDGQFFLQLTSLGVGAGVCLAGCLAGIATSVGPLVDCLKSAPDRKAAIDCINKNGVWQAIGALSCIYGCLHI